MKKKYLDKVNEVSRILQDDGVVIIPTDTIFGFSCKINSEFAIKKIRELKQRDGDKPFLILDSDLQRVRDSFHSSEDKDSVTNRLIDKLVEEGIWPNNLTLIARKNSSLKKFPFLKNIDTVAVRYTDNSVISEITNQLRNGILSTSINISGEKSLDTITEIKSQYLNNRNIKYILSKDRTEKKKNVNSTIIMLDIDSKNDNILNIIREGNPEIVKKVKLLFEKDFIL